MWMETRRWWVVGAKKCAARSKLKKGRDLRGASLRAGGLELGWRPSPSARVGGCAAEPGMGGARLTGVGAAQRALYLFSVSGLLLGSRVVWQLN